MIDADIQSAESTIDWDKLRSRKIFFACPLGDDRLQLGLHAALQSLTALCIKHRVPFGEKYVSCDSLVPRARNRLAAFFRRSDATDFFFVDSDISFDPIDLLSICQLDEPIVGGIYSRKQIDWNRIARAVRAGVPSSDLPYFGTMPVLNWISPGELRLDALHQVRHQGTGFLRIRREVFDTMIARYGDDIAFDYSSDEEIFKGEVGYDFFYSGIDKRHPLGSGRRQYLSEDWGFCERAIECGYSIYVAPWVSTIHRGHHEFPNDFLKLDEASRGVEYDTGEGEAATAPALPTEIVSLP